MYRSNETIQRNNILKKVLKCKQTYTLVLFNILVDLVYIFYCIIIYNAGIMVKILYNNENYRKYLI